MYLDPWEHLGYWGLIGNNQVRDPEIFYSKDAMIQSIRNSWNTGNTSLP